ncbi:hypothetical protein FQR65_LT18216 [Abscondita terminalis]|nr:hypothetical protein FQR65_LT18216 [Abscondita terminalis]
MNIDSTGKGLAHGRLYGFMRPGAFGLFAPLLGLLCARDRAGADLSRHRRCSHFVRVPLSRHGAAHSGRPHAGDRWRFGVAVARVRSAGTELLLVAGGPVGVSPACSANASSGTCQGAVSRAQGFEQVLHHDPAREERSGHDCGTGSPSRSLPDGAAGARTTFNLRHQVLQARDGDWPRHAGASGFDRSPCGRASRLPSPVGSSVEMPRR